MKAEIEIDTYPQLRFAIETLEIERCRLLKAIRKLRSVPTTDNEYLFYRINEHTVCLSEIVNAISLIRICVEAARQARQHEYALPAKRSQKPRPKQFKFPKSANTAETKKSVDDEKLERRRRG
jgi:hypothetical protein